MHICYWCCCHSHSLNIINFSAAVLILASSQFKNKEILQSKSFRYTDRHQVSLLYRRCPPDHILSKLGKLWNWANYCDHLVVQLWHRDIGDQCTVDLVEEPTIPLIFGVCPLYKGISIVIRLPILSFGITLVCFWGIGYWIFGSSWFFTLQIADKHAYV